jgi:hypothetical protein
MRSKWLNWTPQDGIFEKVADTPPPKPPKVAFEGFEGDQPGGFPKIGAPESRVFPHCPRCASYALYRKNNQGNYECLTCGMQDIGEAVARRVQ